MVVKCGGPKICVLFSIVVNECDEAAATSPIELFVVESYNLWRSQVWAVEFGFFSIPIWVYICTYEMEKRQVGQMRV